VVPLAEEVQVVLVGTVAVVMVLYVGIHVAVHVGLGGGAAACGAPRRRTTP
jgi:hypothetical protein